MHTKNKNGTTQGLLLLSLFPPFSFNYKQKQPLKIIIHSMFHPAHHNYQTGCLLRSIISMIHLDKIKLYSQLHISMTSLTNFSTSVSTHHPDLFSLSLIGCQAMTTEFSSLPIGHPSTWLIIISHC